jgi:hypothetical protein
MEVFRYRKIAIITKKEVMYTSLPNLVIIDSDIEHIR